MHLASSERFADEIDPAVVEYEAAKYYANILLPFSPLVAKAARPAADARHRPAGHRPRPRADLAAGPRRILGCTRPGRASSQRRKAVIVYDTMWHSTALMAHAIADGLDAGGVERQAHAANGQPPQRRRCTSCSTPARWSSARRRSTTACSRRVADSLTYLKGLKPADLIGAAFGSYGWSGEAVGQVKEYLEAMKVELVDEGLRQKFVPDAKCLGECAALGKTTAEKLIARVG